MHTYHHCCVHVEKCVRACYTSLRPSFYSKMLGISLLLSLVLCFKASLSSGLMTDCPCTDPALCNAITSPPRKEVFAFWVGKNDWMKYDWSKLTTVVMFAHYDAKLMCYAHSKGVRVTLLANFPASNLSSIADRSAWVIAQVNKVIEYHMDGINIDFEYALDAKDAKYLTALVDETTKTFHLSIPGSQVTFDVSWSPSCIDGRCYDFKGLADVCDFLFVMSYDEQSQIWGPCIAMANSPYNKTVKGIEAFLKLGIPANQLVLGVPWYGYNYECLNFTTDNVCSIKHVKFRGAPCSDAAGKQLDYGVLMKLLSQNSTSGRQYNTTYGAPFFNYKDVATNKTHQVWYDDPVSLTARYKYAYKTGLRGVGMWNADTLDYSNQSRKQTKAMWDAIGKYFTPTRLVPQI